MGKKHDFGNLDFPYSLMLLKTVLLAFWASCRQKLLDQLKHLLSLGAGTHRSLHAVKSLQFVARTFTQLPSS